MANSIKPQLPRPTDSLPSVKVVPETLCGCHMLCGKKDTSLQDKTQKPYKAAPDAAALWLVVGARIARKGTMALGLCEPPLLSLAGREPPKKEKQESLFRDCYKQEGNPPHTSRTLLSHPCTSPTGQPLMSARFLTLCI